MTHWTYSRLADFEKCPALYEGRYGNRWPGIEQKQHPAAARGERLHGLMEQAFVHGTKLTGALAKYNEYVDNLRRWPFGKAEEELAIDAAWKRCAYGDKKRLWWRGKADVLMLNLQTNDALVTDWKSGGIYGSNADQVRLYAGVIFELYPKIKSCNVELVYLDQGQAISETIKRADWAALRADFTTRATALTSAKRFPVKPGKHCAYCQFGPAKGGPCTAGVQSGSGLQTGGIGARLVAVEAAPLRRRHARPDFSDPAQPVGVRGAKNAAGRDKPDPKDKNKRVDKRRA